MTQAQYRQNTISSQVDFESLVQTVTSANLTAALCSVSNTTTRQLCFRETSKRMSHRATGHYKANCFRSLRSA